MAHFLAILHLYPFEFSLCQCENCSASYHGLNKLPQILKVHPISDSNYASRCLPRCLLLVNLFKALKSDCLAGEHASSEEYRLLLCSDLCKLMF